LLKKGRELKMGLKQFESTYRHLDLGDPRLSGPHHAASGHVGHARFWERALSRRQFLKAAGVSATALGAALYLPGRSIAHALNNAAPKPIPGGLQPFGPGTEVFHVLLPEHPISGFSDPATSDPSLITDFNGHIGLAYVRGMGTHTDKNTGVERHLPFEVDLRFMKGEYVGQDGRHHHGAFALI
jgi:hypothetical protein